jgi:hypothetical protein
MALDQSVERRPITGSGATARGRANALPATLVIAGVVLASIVVHYLLALDQPAPWLMGDELRYAEMAKSFLDDGKMLFRDELTSFATAYPVLIAPAWAVADVGTAYEIAKAINVVLMTMSAVVVFFWTRRLASTSYALVAAGLVLLMPTFVYTGMLMMENAALPAFLLGAFVIALALERPTLRWQVAVFAAIAFAALLRVQVVTLAIVYPTAILLAAVFAQRARAQSIRTSLARFSPSFAILVVGALGYVAYKLLSGRPLTSGLGAYSSVGEVDYDAGQVARWFLWHFGELALSVGFIPVVAFGVLLAAAIRRGSLPAAADRAFVAVAAASAFWFVLQAAAFASRFSGRIEERYMVYAAPLLLIALPVWLARSLPRQPVATLVAALLPALLVMTIPFERMFNVPILADTFGLIPFLRLSTFLGGGVSDLPLVVAGGLAVAGVSFATFSLRVARLVFPAAVALFFVLSAYTVYGAVEVQSEGARASSGVSDPSWVDSTLGHSGQVGFIYSASVNANPHLLWQTEFWNRSVRGVYALGTDNALTYGGSEIKLGATGRLVPKVGRPVDSIDEPYVLADPSLGIVGDVVAKPGPLALIRVEHPVRVASAVDGIYADGWSGPQASLSQYKPFADGARRVRIRISREGWGGPDVPGRVTITVGPLRMTEAGPTIARVTATRTWTVHSAQGRAFVLTVPTPPFRLEVRVTPTFSPAQFGLPDARQLGAQVAFSPAGG